MANRHMDKQNEVLMEAYRSMLHELQKLQVVIFLCTHNLWSANTDTHWNGLIDNDKFFKKELVERNTCFGHVSLSDIGNTFLGYWDL